MTIDLPKLYKHQQDVMKGLINHWSGSFHIVKSRRQCGKSILGEIILQYAALTRERQRAYLISPTFAQADKILTEIKDLVLDKPFFKSINNVKRIINFKNRSEIRVFSAEQGEEALRGYTCELLICDEAAYLSDNIIDCILPWTNVFNAPVIMFSTPAGRSGRFYEYFTSTEPDIYQYDWVNYDMSMLLSPAKLEMYRKTMDPLKFKTDYLGLFLDSESKFFGDYSGCVKQKISYNGEPVVMAIDWNGGTLGNDYTALTVLGKISKTVYDLRYFNDKDPKQTLQEVLAYIISWRPEKVVVELNSIGNVYYGLLRDELKLLKIPLHGFTTTNESKDKIISKLQVAFQNNEISIYEDKELMDELLNYEMIFSKTGKRIMNAASGHHDDVIMSLAMAYNSINSGIYSVA